MMKKVVRYDTKKVSGEWRIGCAKQNSVVMTEYVIVIKFDAGD